VLAAATYPAASIYFHDEQLYPEAAGFWTIGGRSAHVTAAAPPGQALPVVVRIHPGAKPNSITLSTFGWRRSYDLVPGQAVEVELPQFASGVVPLTISSETGFYPRDIDPQSSDRRFLGVWVEFKTGPTATP